MAAKITFSREADFRRERDFGAKVGATFDFVAAQFGPLLKCLAYFVLPGALLTGIGLGLFLNNFLALLPQFSQRAGHSANGSFQTYSAASGLFSGSSYVSLSLTFVGVLVVFLLLSSTVYGFVRVRLRTPAAEVVQPAQVWAAVWPRLGRVLGAWLLLAGLLAGGMGLVGGALAALGPGFVVLLFFPLAWATVCLTLYFPALWLEDDGVLAALRRAFYLAWGKWWSSLGLYLVMSFIAGIVNYLFLIPLYGLMAVRMLKIPGFDSELLTVAASSIYVLGALFTSVLPLLAMLFQYFNLVERRDGVGLRQQLQSLGQTAVPRVSSAAYQADEEGEY